MCAAARRNRTQIAHMSALNECFLVVAHISFYNLCFMIKMYTENARDCFKKEKSVLEDRLKEEGVDGHTLTVDNGTPEPSTPRQFSLRLLSTCIVHK